MKPWFYIFFTGIIWLFIGFYLFAKGINFLSQSNLKASYFSLIVIAALLVGLLKERYILQKTVKRISKKISSFTGSVSIFKIYDARFYMVIFMMIILGQLLKAFYISLVIRGAIDLAVGLALIKGGGSFLLTAICSRKASRGFN